MSSSYNMELELQLEFLAVFPCYAGGSLNSHLTARLRQFSKNDNIFNARSAHCILTSKYTLNKSLDTIIN